MNVSTHTDDCSHVDQDTDCPIPKTLLHALALCLDGPLAPAAAELFSITVASSWERHVNGSLHHVPFGAGFFPLA